MEMTPKRWENTCAYLAEVFGDQEQHLNTLMRRAVEAGLPNIAVSPEVGRLLKMLTHMAGGVRALEIGTLAGYSAIWIARGLRPGGRLVTIESEAKHADFAKHALFEAGIADRVEVRRGKALEVLPVIAKELGPASLDLAFFDAVKAEYAQYYEHVRPLIRVGGVLVADNVLGTDRWWIDDAAGNENDRDGVDAFNRRVAADPEFEAVAVPLRQGVLIARRVKNASEGRLEL
jgi:caffeoyl-CoA O-methyltransferase